MALCPETDVASQGNTVDGTRDNLKEVLELFFEGVSRGEIKQRLQLAHLNASPIFLL